MMVILMIKGCARHTKIQIKANSTLGIQPRRDFEESVRGPPGDNILDCSRGFKTLGSEYLSSVDNISGSHGGS